MADQIMADQKRLTKTRPMSNVDQLDCYAYLSCQHNITVCNLKYCPHVNTPTQTQLVLNYDESDVLTAFLVA